MDPEQLAKSGSEWGEQAAIFCWSKQNEEKYPELKYLFAMPSGGLRDKITAGRMKAAGTKVGIPDIFLPVKRGGYSGLWIELKKVKGKTAAGKPTKEQLEWICFLQSQGFGAMVCVGYIQAKDAL